VGKASRSSTASDAEWAKVIRRFRALTDLHDPDARRRVQRGCRLLKKEATAIYAAADVLEREDRHDASPAKYQAARVARRVIKDGRLDGDVFAEYLDRWARNRDAVVGTPEDLRAHGHAIWRFADVFEGAPKIFLEQARTTRRGDQGGALPSVAMDYLIEHTTKWGATLREIAERLIEDDVMPPPSRSEDSDPDPTARWISIVRMGRSRSRRR
jgi:hypothetical protein